MSEAKSLPRSIPVAIHVGTDRERVVNVEKLPLGRAAQLGLAFRGIPAKIQELRQREGLRELFAQEGIDELPLTELAMKLVEYLPDVLAVAADAIIDILVAGTGIERAELEQVGLDEATELLAAVITVNNLEAIQRNVKNALSRLGISLATTTQATPAAGSKT